MQRPPSPYPPKTEVDHYTKIIGCLISCAGTDLIPKKSKKYSKSSNFAKRSLFFWHYKTHDIFIKTASGKDEKLSNGLISQNCPVCQILHN